MNAILEIGLNNALMALVLAMVAAAAATMRKSHPALVHALWLLVFVKLLTPPLIAVPVPVLFERLDGLVVETYPSEATEPGRTDGNAAVPSDHNGRWFDGQDDSGALELDLGTKSVPDRAFVSSPEDALPLGTSGRDESSATSHSTAARGASGVRGIVIAVWLAGSLTLLGVSAVLAWRVCRLLAFARPAPSELQEEVRRLARRLKMARSPEVLIVSGRISPMVWPIGRRARILLPTNLLEQLTREERSTVLAHELAHVKRRDHWFRLVELVCTVLYWWHPVVWWARSRLRRAEEECCDAWVVTTLPDSAQSYAAALLKTLVLFSQLPQRRPIPDPISSGATTTRLLERRLIMIYREGTPLHLGCRWGVFLVLLAALVLPIVPGRTSIAGNRRPVRRHFHRQAPRRRPAPMSRSHRVPPPRSVTLSQDANEGQPFRLFDSFDGKLELDWEVIRPDPTHVSLEKTPGRLTITSQRGGLFQGGGDGSPQKIGLAVMNEDGTSAPLDAAFDFFEVRSLTDEEKNDPLYLERRKLQGTWQVVSSRLGGRATEKSLWSRFEFHGIEVTLSGEGAGFTSKYTPHLEKEPKGLAFTGLGRELWRNHTRAYQQDRNLMNAVYSIEKDRLVICIDPRQGAPAPTALETKEGDGRLLLELQRLPDVEIAAIRRNAQSAKQLVDWLDVDHDGQLTLEEFTSDWPTPAAIDRAREVFDLVDRDKDGRVTLDEYQKRPNKAAFLLMDVDQDDRLTLTEASSGSPFRDLSPDRAQAVFKLIDKDDEFWKADQNGDNRLNREEFEVSRIWTAVGDWRAAFRPLDQDRDDNISLWEFQNRPDSDRPNAANDP